MLPRRRAIERLGVVGFVLALLLLAAVGVRAWLGVQALRSASEDAEHGYREVAAAESLRADLEQAGRHFRAFVRTRDHQRLTDLDGVLTHAEVHLTELDAPDGDDVQRRVVAAADEYGREMEALAVAATAPGADDRELLRQSDDAMEDVLLAIDDFERDRRAVVGGKETTQLAAAQVAGSEVAGGASFAFGLLVLSVVVAAREAGRRDVAEARLRGLVESAPDGLVIVDRAGRIVIVNAATERMLGWSRDELIGGPVEVLIPADAAARHQKALAGFLASPRVGRMNSNLELKAKRRDGTLVPVDVSIGYLGEGAERLAMASIRDLSEVRRIEAELERWAEEARDLYDHAPCGYHSLDGEGRVVRVNATEAAWFGLPADALLGRSVRDFMTPGSQRQFDEAFPRFRETGLIEDVEFDFVTADGAIRTLSVNANAVRGTGGELLRTRTTLVDVTERRRIEAERAGLIAELKRALAEVRTLSGMLPLCAWCKKIRDDHGYWEQMEAYVVARTDASFTHGICPDCAARLAREDPEPAA